MKTFTLVFTGGHHNSSLEVARYLQKLGHRLSWFGHRYTGRHDTHDSAEFIEVTGSGIEFYDLKAGKLGAGTTLQSLLDIPLGIYRARRLLKKVRPQAVVSFGSYLGASTAVAAVTLGIPVFLDEQTVTAGKANLLVARFAKHIFLTWDSSKKYFPKQKTSVVGLPLRPSILKPTKISLFNNSKPTLLFMGGKQGSAVINNLVFSHLPELLSSYNLIHQTGTSTHTGHYLKALNLKEALPEKLSQNYQVRGYIGEDEIGSLFSVSDLVISRSGAHTIYELGILGKKSLLIPYPYTHDREQYRNASFLEKHGISHLIVETELNFPSLTSHIKKALAAPNPMPLNLPHQATKVIAEAIIKLI